MTITTLTSRQFNQHASEAKKAANHGPVFITDRGKPAHVLLCIDDYRKLTGEQMTLGEAIAQYHIPDFEFEAPRVEGLTRPADLT